MKKFLPLLIFFLSAFLFAEKITVFRKVNELLVQSRWSEEKDLIIHISRFANEASYLVKHGSDIRNYKKGIRLHQSYDEYDYRHDQFRNRCFPFHHREYRGGNV